MVSLLLKSLLVSFTLVVAQKDDNKTDRRNLLLVNTTSGLIRGVEELGSNGKPIWRYLGIPFAEPPTGKKRFLPPERFSRREGIFLANQQPNSCMQNAYMGTDFLDFLKKYAIPSPVSEDCLYLNIFKPATDFGAPKDGRAVMVWLYGGAFTKGSIAYPLYDGSVLSSEEGVIVVSINYRLSAFGYLFLDHPGVPGNAGLYDQLMGITWVKENIKAFGGDPDRITVFGESAGAASTALLMISPESRGIFNRGILESGSSTTPWATLEVSEALRRSLTVAKDLGCLSQINETNASLLESYWRTKANSYVKEATVSCLLSSNVQDFLDNEPFVVDGCSFAPIVDGRILPKKPKELLKDRTDFSKASNRANPLQVMMGTNSNEGTLFFLYLLPDVFDVFDQTAFLERKEFTQTLRQFSPYKIEDVQQAVEFFYADWNQFTQDRVKTDANGTLFLDKVNYQDSLDSLVGDYFFTCPMKATANAAVSSYLSLDGLDNPGILPAKPSAYVYKYEHRSSVSKFPAWMGVFHSHELEFVFGEPLHVSPDAPKYTEKEKLFGRRVLRLWANFARTGDPNISPEGKEGLMENTLRWPVWTTKSQEFLRLSARSISPDFNLRARECLLWDSYMPSIVQRAEHYNKTITYYKNIFDNQKKTHDKQQPVVINSLVNNDGKGLGNPIATPNYFSTACSVTLTFLVVKLTNRHIVT